MNKLEQAARQALEALENSRPDGDDAIEVKRFFEAITALREALAQPQDHSDKQDPIAYLFTDIQSGDTEASCDPKYKQSATWIREPLCLISQDSPQPQGEWVDLTEEEIRWAWLSESGAKEGLHAVIAKFKEKNTPFSATQAACQMRDAAIKTLKNMHTRIEPLGGQKFKYIQLQEALDEIAALPVLVVPQGEPVAWLRKDHTKTMSNEDKLSWIAAGHTDITDEYTIPLYTTPPSVEAAIAETKEKAAKVCENITDADAFTLNKCAAAIRSMK